MRLLGNSIRRIGLATIVVATVGLTLSGCEIRPKPHLHVVDYRSTSVCTPSATDCPWERLEREAEFSALVNCLLAGSNVLHIVEEGGDPAGESAPRVVAPVPPRYGYERLAAPGAEDASCTDRSTMCSVASRSDRAYTLATCGARPLSEAELRGGEDIAGADVIADSGVLTGTLARATDDYRPPEGLDGPDHVYRFTLAERTRVEAAVVANRATWSGVVGLVRSAWQPALHLVTADGARLQQGYVLRAGVTALFPSELEPGTYYLVVDSSLRESARGDGLYRLYVGFNQTVMGPVIPQGVDPAFRGQGGYTP